jgi:hypothetical protein
MDEFDSAIRLCRRPRRCASLTSRASNWAAYSVSGPGRVGRAGQALGHRAHLRGTGGRAPAGHPVSSQLNKLPLLDRDVAGNRGAAGLGRLQVCLVDDASPKQDLGVRQWEQVVGLEVGLACCLGPTDR